MSMERKTIRAAIKQAGDDGSFEAVVATFGVVDHDGDVIESGAFAGHPIPVLPGHKQTHVPLGKAQIVERGNLAVAVGRFNMEIPAAREWHSALKFDLAEVQPAVQEWSWGFVVKFPGGIRPDTIDGKPVRRIIKLDEREVSPVLRGAAIGSRTLAVKRRKAEGMSDTDLRERLEVALRDEEGDVEHLWVEAVFDDVVVYNARRGDETGRTFERGYELDGDKITLGSDPVEVVRDVSYQPVVKGEEADGIKLIEQIRLTTHEVDAAVARVASAVDARQKRGRDIGPDTKAAAMAMAERCNDLDSTMGQLRAMAEKMMPKDEAARAAAKFLATDALRLGVDV